MSTSSAIGFREDRTGRSAVGKATTILAELAAAPAPLTLSELTRRTGLAKTTTYRLLGALTADGVVRRFGRRYRLDHEVTWLADPVDERVGRLRHLRCGMLPHLIELYERTHQTVNLAVLQDDEVIYVERIYGHNRVASRSDGIDRAPAHLTAAGRLLLAYEPHSGPVVDTREAMLSGIRREGVAYSFGDLTPGVCCAAAPVRDRTGQAVAAVSLAGPAREFDPRQYALRLRRTAHALSVVARKSGALRTPPRSARRRARRPVG
jgi:DNA-binding IclR family transcriptional regulator